MLATLDVFALIGGVGLVALAARMTARTDTRAAMFERAGGALLAGALVGLGLLIARAAG